MHESVSRGLWVPISELESKGDEGGIEKHVLLSLFHMIFI